MTSETPQIPQMQGDHPLYVVTAFSSFDHFGPMMITAPPPVDWPSLVVIIQSYPYFLIRFFVDVVFVFVPLPGSRPIKKSIFSLFIVSIDWSTFTVSAYSFLWN